MLLWEISVLVDGEAAEAVSEVMSRCAPGGVVVETILLPGESDREYALNPETRVKCYLPVADGADRLETLQDALWRLRLIYPMPDPVVREMSEADWATAWQQDYHTVRIGRRLVIVPEWENYDPAPDDLVVRLEPGLAFGTGLHPTTRLCAQVLEDRVLPGQRVLDVGTGSAILAIAAARLGAGEVLGTEIDPVAVQAARENIDRNGVGDVVTVVESSSPDEVGAWDVVVANILPHILLDMADALVAATTSHGVLVLSGILDTRVDEVALGLAARGMRLIEQRQEKDWTALILSRY
jgi:ribosomal protein L11 methyltransferase